MTWHTISSLNQVRVRDVIAEDSRTFDIHLLSNNKEILTENGEQLMMRLKCPSEESKDEWVKAINKEIKELKSEMKNLSRDISLLNQ